MAAEGDDVRAAPAPAEEASAALAGHAAATQAAETGYIELSPETLAQIGDVIREAAARHQSEKCAHVAKIFARFLKKDELDASLAAGFAPLAKAMAETRAAADALGVALDACIARNANYLKRPAPAPAPQAAGRMRTRSAHGGKRGRTAGAVVPRDDISLRTRSRSRNGALRG